MRFALAFDGVALMLDPAHADPQLGQLEGHLLFAGEQFVHRSLRGAELLLKFGLPGFRSAQTFQNGFAALLLLGVLLFDGLQFGHDGVDLAFEVAAFGRQRVEFALFRGERDFLRVKIGAESGKFSFERSFFLFQFGLGRFLCRNLRGQLSDFLRKRADLADMTLRDGAEDAVFVNEFATQCGDGEMRVELAQRERGIQVAGDDDTVQQGTDERFEASVADLNDRDRVHPVL